MLESEVEGLLPVWFGRELEVLGSWTRSATEQTISTGMLAKEERKSDASSIMSSTELKMHDNSWFCSQSFKASHSCLRIVGSKVLRKVETLGFCGA